MIVRGKGDCMKTFKCILAGAVSVLLLAGCAPMEPAMTKTESQRFADYTRQQFCELVGENAINLNYTLSRPEDWDIERPTEAPFGELDLDFASQTEDLKEDREELEGFDRSQLTEDQLMTWDAIDFYLTTQEQTVGKELYNDLLGPVTGQHANMLITLAEFSFYEEADLEEYMALLEDLPRYFDYVAEYERARADAGMVASADTLNEAADFCDMIADAPEDCLLVTGFADRLAELDWLEEEDRERYEAQNQELVCGPVAEAYRSLGACARELAAQGGEPQGLAARQEDGADYYQLLMRSMVGSDRPLEEYQQMLVDDINANLDEMDALYQQDPEGYEAYFTTVPEQGTLPAEEIIDQLREASKDDFPALEELPYTVKDVPTALEAYTSPAFFMVPPIDSQDKNTIYINNSMLDPTTLFTTLAHEGYPGHLYQTVYTYLLDLDPLNDELSAPGYSEGWASYVEFEYGYSYMDESETYRSLARLYALINLEISALVDIQVNWVGWSEEELASWLSDMGFDPASADALMAHICAEPGNYMTYAGGYLEFMELRQTAEDTLGGAFDELEFHTWLLDQGPAAFPLLADRLNDWLESETALDQAS